MRRGSGLSLPSMSGGWVGHLWTAAAHAPGTCSHTAVIFWRKEEEGIPCNTVGDSGDGELQKYQKDQHHVPNGGYPRHGHATTKFMELLNPKEKHTPQEICETHVFPRPFNFGQGTAHPMELGKGATDRFETRRKPSKLARCPRMP